MYRKKPAQLKFDGVRMWGYNNSTTYDLTLDRRDGILAISFFRDLVYPPDLVYLSHVKVW